MSILQILIWIWVLPYLVVITWYYRNPDFIEGYHKDFEFFDFNFFKLTIYMLSLVVAPTVFMALVVTGIRGFFKVTLYKWKLHWKLRKLSDSDAKKYLSEELKKI